MFCCNDKQKGGHISTHTHLYRNGAPQIMEVCVATAVPARKPFGCPLVVWTTRESREILTSAHAVSCVRAFQWRTFCSTRASFLVLLNQVTEPTSRSSDGERVLSLGDAPRWGKTLTATLLSNKLRQCQSLPTTPKTHVRAKPLPWAWEVQWAGSGFVPGRSGFPVGPALKVGLTRRANCQQSPVQQRTNLASCTVDE